MQNYKIFPSDIVIIELGLKKNHNAKILVFETKKQPTTDAINALFLLKFEPFKFVKK